MLNFRDDVDGKLVVGRQGKGWTCEGRGAMGEGRGGWQGFGERGKCREVAGRGDGKRQRGRIERCGERHRRGDTRGSLVSPCISGHNYRPCPIRRGSFVSFVDLEG